MTGIASFLLLLALPVHAQFGRGDGVWSTSGGDAQRSSWVRTDPKISPESMQKPGFGFIWKVKLNNEPRQLNSLTAVSLLDRYIGYRGFRSLGFLGGSSDNIVALDTDLGRVEWQKRLTPASAPQGSLECPGGMTATVSRPVTTAFPAMPAGRGGGGGRGAAAKSAVGAPDEGAVTIAEIAARAGAGPGGPGGRGGAGRGAPGGPPRRMPNYIHAVSSDGMFHSLWVSNGEEPDPPVRFLPGGTNVYGLIVVNNVAYAATGQRCGAAPNAVWALDLESKQVASWKADGTDIAGTEGTAFGPDGTLYVATTGGDLMALEAKTLAVKGAYSGGKPGFVSSPVIFEMKDKTLLAAATKDDRIHLLDTASMSSAVYQTPASADGSASSSGAFAAWQDASGNAWLLAPAANAIVAWKVSEQSLERAWTSRELVSPLAPMVLNGVVFAVSSGEYRTQDAKMTAPQRAQRSAPAVIYALDGATGKELWNSGKTITSFVHGGGISGGSSQLYLGTYDGTLYAFGFGIEH
ncbi:Pyrrolo-quinoline quinone [Candidatus Sulfopaludibacter sp. SbA3]|nr:Pyrrolo-quinoline quinone [Candidatus Sulfopaludibacter sp. SbA3]